MGMQRPLAQGYWLGGHVRAERGNYTFVLCLFFRACAVTEQNHVKSPQKALPVAFNPSDTLREL